MCNDTVKMVSHLRKQVPTYKKSSSSQFNLQIFADFFFTKMSMLANNLKCVIFSIMSLSSKCRKNIISHNPRNERMKYISQNFSCFSSGSLLWSDVNN